MPVRTSENSAIATVICTFIFCQLTPIVRTQQCNSLQTALQLVMHDTGADGWEGTFLEIRQQGSDEDDEPLLVATLDSGTTGTTSVCAVSAFATTYL